MRNKLHGQDVKLYKEALDLFKNNDLQTSFIKLTQAELISPNIEQIKKSKQIVRQLLINQIFKDKYFDVKNDGIDVSFKNLVNNGISSVNEILSKDQLEILKDKKKKIRI